MKRNALCFFTAVVLLLSLIPAIPAAAEVLTISTLAELEAFRDSVNSGEDYHGVTVTLTADIDLGGEENQWTPIGYPSKPFSGTFDGKGHTISGLYINQPDSDYQGLFGENMGTIQNLAVEGFVSGYSYIGGIAGRSLRTITNCSFAGTVSGFDSVGGLVGYHEYGTLSGCSHSGTVSGAENVGGMIGYHHGIITTSYSTGTVGGDEYTGGVAGYNDGSITDCYHIGGVYGSSYTGGVAGRNSGVLTNCYHIGTVSGTSHIGGITGSGSDDVVSCYYLAGTVTGDSTTTDTDTEDSGAIHETAFAQQSTFSNWDFADTWTLDTQIGRPVLQTIPEASGALLFIESRTALRAFEDKVNRGNDYAGVTVMLTADIDLRGDEKNQWTPIGSVDKPFAGIFDGGGHQITGLYIHNTADGQGLFGYNTGTIQNLGVAGDVQGGTQVGGIAALNAGVITSCYYSGDTNGSAVVGSIAGRNTGTVADCYHDGVVNGSNTVGGVAGENIGTVANCYNAGAVSGTQLTGGVVGKNSGAVSGCYYLTGVVTVNGAAADTDAGDAVPISEAAFAERATFADWTFHSIWTISPSLGRPVLRRAPECGVADLPIYISSSFGLKTFRDSVNYGNTYEGKTIVLTADIYLGGRVDSQWTPIGLFDHNSPHFAGTFDGDGHSITGLYINNQSYTIAYAGLFGASCGTIQNLHVEGVVIGSLTAGSIVGLSIGTVTNCSYKGSVRGSNKVGGVVGENRGGIVTDCCHIGDISASFPSGSVIARSVCGGVAGENTGTVSGCYHIGDIDGCSVIGGVVGDNAGTVTDCYHDGVVNGSNTVGGVAGENIGTVANCYNAGAVSGTQLTGGVAGENTGAVSGCYYLTGAVTVNGTAADTDAGDSAAISEDAFAQQSTFAGWDFADIWIMRESFGRPVLRALPEDPDNISELPFADVPRNAWYYKPVRYVFQYGMMSGVSGTEFAPDADVTRGMFVTMLYRMAREKVTTVSPTFDDISLGDYYTDAVSWAHYYGIVNGVSEDHFAPDESITREQMAAILQRYAQHKGHLVTGRGVLAYADNDSISDYARDAVTWASFMGILQGNADGTFAPAANVTRAEAAAVFQRMVEKLQ